MSVTVVVGSAGTSLSVILGVDVTLAIVASAAVSVLYTMFGGMVAVAYTDVVQLLFIMAGLVSIYDVIIGVTIMMMSSS